MYERRTIGVVVDAGHGGEDPGALGNGLKEKDLNLQAANYMYKRLNELGIPAVITRDTDRTLTRQERINTALNSFGRNSDVILVSNHINAGNGEGAEIVYALRNSPALAQMALDNIGAAGQKMRKIYQRRLPENPNQDYYYIIRDTNPLQSMLVEYGFIDNTNDAAKLRSNLNNYVEGVVKAIADYLNVPYSMPGDVPISDQVYTVKRGDTLYSISRFYNIPVSELKRINNLTSDTLSIGQQLYLVPLQDDIISSDYITYVVQRGDSLSKIASEFNTDINTIKNVNNLSSNIIQIGQQLLIPTDVIDYEPVIDGYQEYIVQRGDSLSKIATIFNTDINTIKTLNNLTSNTILIGQVLKVPNGVDDSSNDLTYTEYMVSRGDSLWKIAKDFNTTVNEIMEFNGLTSANLQIGDVLKIPNRNNYNSGNNDDFSVNNYTVQRGDSLWSIAKNFNTTVDKIKNTNGLSSNLLSVGQVLIIP